MSDVTHFRAHADREDVKAATELDPLGYAELRKLDDSQPFERTKRGGTLSPSAMQ